MNKDFTRDSSLVSQKAEWDPVLFKETPRRWEVARLKPAWELKPMVIRVHRNHAIEHVAAATAAWAAYAEIGCEWNAGAYDDSLSWGELSGDAELELVWYDSAIALARLGAADFAEWIVGRLRELRRKSRSPILVCVAGLPATVFDLIHAETGDIPGVRMPDIDSLFKEGEMFDERLAKASGSRLSEVANMRLARLLGCSWLPSMIAPRLKAVLVDLDLTLYRGVLGEDGLSVELTEGHRMLQQTLLELRQSGLFIGIVSRNELRDVMELFEKRKDFPLRWDSLDTRQVGWGPKSLAVANACAELRISTDAALYIDDNLGELLEIAGSAPHISLLHANPNPTLTLSALRHFPGLWSWGNSEADLVRQTDLRANQERNRVAGAFAADPDVYFKELAPEVSIGVDDVAAARRLHELSQKTNQFNLALRRLTEIEVAEYLASPDMFAVTLSMKDRLSDSGIIAAMFGRKSDHDLLVDEWVISCRALGRGLEDYMATQALLAVARGARFRDIVFAYRRGPRNTPGLAWLESYAGAPVVDETGRLRTPFEGLRGAAAPISLRVTHHGKK